MPWFDHAEFEELNHKLTGSEYAEAAQQAKEASESIVSGFDLMIKGDKLGGASSLLNGAGNLASLGALLGPGGAAAGGVFKLLAGIIASILEAMNGEKESLEAQIEKVLVVENLKQHSSTLKSSEARWRSDGENYVEKMAAARDAVIDYGKAGKTFDKDKDATDDMFFPEDYTPEKMKEGVAWDKLKLIVGAPSRVQEIDNALNYLIEHTDHPLEESAVLLDQAVGYMFRMWMSLPGLGALIDHGSHGGFTSWRDGVAQTWSNALSALELQAQNHNCRIFTRWHDKGSGTFNGWPQPMYERMGVALKEWTRFEMVSTIPVQNFAVASSGTIFSSSQFEESVGIIGKIPQYRKFVRPTAKQQGVDSIPAQGRECEQIFIGELPDVPHLVIVFCTSGDGRILSTSGYNDAPEIEGDKSRWGHWTDWTLNFKIASVAIKLLGNREYGMYLLGLNDDLSVTLYEKTWNSNPTPVEGFHWTKQEVEGLNGMNLLDGGQWSKKPPYSCAISLAPLAVQLGTDVRVKEKKAAKVKDKTVEVVKVVPWGMWNNLKTRTHQGKFYSDDTFVMCSERGVDIFCWNSRDGRYEWINEATNEGEIVQKIPLRNGGMFRALQDKFPHPLKTEE